MRPTRDIKIALQRLIDATPSDWTVDKVTKTGYDLTIGKTQFHTRAVGPTMCSLVQAVYSELGWTRAKVLEVIQWEPRGLPRKLGPHEDLLLRDLGNL